MAKNIDFNMYLVVKNEDLHKYLSDNERRLLCDILNKISVGRYYDGKPKEDKYYVCNSDEEYSDEIREIILKNINK